MDLDKIKPDVENLKIPPPPPTDSAARSAADLQAEWESFAELIGDSALQGPMPVDVMSIPLPDGTPCPPIVPVMPMQPGSDVELEAQTEDFPAAQQNSSSDESDDHRARKSRRKRSHSNSKSRSSSSSSGSESDSSESEDSSDSEDEEKKNTTCTGTATSTGSCEMTSDMISPENIPMPDAADPSDPVMSTNQSERLRTESFTSVTSDKSSRSRKDSESAAEDNRRKNSHRKRSNRSRSRDRRRRSRSRNRKRRRRSRSRSRDRRRRRGRRSRSRDRKGRRRSRSRSRDRRRRKRRSHSRTRRRSRDRSTSRGRGRSSKERRRRRSRERGGPSKAEGGVTKRTLTFKEQLKKSFIEAQREIEKTGTCSLSLESDAGSGNYKPNEKPSNLPLYDNPLLAVTGGTDLTKAGAPSQANTPQLAFLQTMQAMHKKAQELTGVAVPKYYNPAAVNPLKYAEQVQKRKLLWSKNKEEKKETAVPAATPWQSSVFSQDQDGKVSAKFRKLMGIKQDEGQQPLTNEDDDCEQKKKQQQEMFQRLDQEYEMARIATHTHRGIGLGFSSHGHPPTTTSK